MRNNRNSLSLGILFLASLTAMGQVAKDKPAKAKRVFTNDDLNKLGEKYGSESNPEQATPPTHSGEAVNRPVQTNLLEKSMTQDDKTYWVAKLKDANTALEKAKEQELKFYGIVKKYEQKLRDAKGDFHIKTSQEQVADSLKNLARSKEDLKKAEETKAKLLAEAEKNGLKREDLLEPTKAASAKVP